MKNKANKTKQMDVAQLKVELMELLREQFNLRVQQAVKQLTKTHHLKAVRRKIAQVKTILHEKIGQAS